MLGAPHWSCSECSHCSVRAPAKLIFCPLKYLPPRLLAAAPSTSGREHEIEMFSQVKGNWDHLLVFSCHRRQVLPLRRFKLTDFSQRGANKLIETIDGVKQTWDRRGGSPRPRPPGCAKQTPQTYFNYFQGSLGGFLRLNCHRFSVSSWPAPAASVCEVNTKTRKLGKSLLH